ncbi:MAG: hypothetical protein KDI44_10130 [Thiothrix sp.]|nr:hypothetical protein [Thiothrix sp.]
MFVLLNDLKNCINDIEAIREANKRYKKYLLSNKNMMPKNAYEFAVAQWRGNPNDPKGIYDGWLDSVIIEDLKEKVDSDCRIVNKNIINIRINILNAFHNRSIEINYFNVKKYILSNNYESHGDLLRDEVRLSEENNVIHEIEWGVDDRWFIECTDISYDSTAFPPEVK